MFEIDLLKGRGIPPRRGPETLAVVAVTVMVPIVAAMLVLGVYLSRSVSIATKQQEIANYEAKIVKLADALKLQKWFDEEQKTINGCLSEVSASIGTHTQWSPVLVTLVENLPSSMVLTKLDVETRSVKKKAPKSNDAKKKAADISVPVRTLHMSVSGNPNQNHDSDVRDFKDRLRFSELLGPKLEEIRVSQKTGILEGQDAVSYEIECIFKPGI
jgi:Tfp pilus assembly protein PilN